MIRELSRKKQLCDCWGKDAPGGGNSRVRVRLVSEGGDGRLVKKGNRRQG